MMEFIQWLIKGAPEAMDGGSNAAFGEGEGGEDRGVYKTSRLRRDQALQVFAMPWNALCEAVEAISLQAYESAGSNRQTNISASLPGQQKLQVEIERLQGSVLIQRTTDEIPQTLAEEEEQMGQLIESSPNVALYQAILNDPANLSVFAKFPSLRDLTIPGAAAVEQQQGEFEILMTSGPVPNPRIGQIQQQIMMAERSILGPQAPEGQPRCSDAVAANGPNPAADGVHRPRGAGQQRESRHPRRHHARHDDLADGPQARATATTSRRPSPRQPGRGSLARSMRQNEPEAHRHPGPLKPRSGSFSGDITKLSSRRAGQGVSGGRVLQVQPTGTHPAGADPRDYAGEGRRGRAGSAGEAESFSSRKAVELGDMMGFI